LRRRHDRPRRRRFINRVSFLFNPVDKNTGPKRAGEVCGDSFKISSAGETVVHVEIV
jgi:hypothetical protein